MTFLRQYKAALAAATLLVAAGCADDKPLNTFEPRGPLADEVYDVMYPYVWGIMAIVFVIVVIGGVLLTIKNKVDGDTLDPDDLPAQTHGHTAAELGWTIAPAVLLAVLSVPMISTIWTLEERSEPDEQIWAPSAPGEALNVMVIGQQWWWEYRYDADGDGFIKDLDGDGSIDRERELPLELVLDEDDIVTANELVIPAGQQIDLILTSRDVIHSFWIPRLNGKRDTVPGRWHTWALEAYEPGKYTGWCTEFCGLSHARMRMSTIALSDADYEAWFANQLLAAEVPEEGTEAWAGRELFAANCMSCHFVNDGDLEYADDFRETVPLAARAAPDLTHFATRTSFAGGIYSSYLGDGTDANDDALNVDDYLKLSELAANPSSPGDYRWNNEEIKRWISDAPGRKDMHSETDPETGLGRGMLPFPQLSDAELDQISAYLASLD